MSEAKAYAPKPGLRPRQLLDGGRFALGLTVGFIVSIFLFLLLDVSDIGVRTDTTLFGAVLGGILAGSTALASTVLSNYYLLKQQPEEAAYADQNIALGILTKLHEARDVFVKSFRHYFNRSRENVIRYGASGTIPKPLAFSSADVHFSDAEKVFLLGRNSHLFNLLLDADSLVFSFNNLTSAYEKQFNKFQEHIFSQNKVNIRGVELSGEISIDPLELLKIEDLRNILKSFLLGSQAPIAEVYDEMIKFIHSEFGRKLEYVQDLEMSGSATNVFAGSHGGG